MPLALTLVARALQKLSLLMLAHLFAPLFDHVAHGLPQASAESPKADARIVSVRREVNSKREFGDHLRFYRVLNPTP